MQYFGPGVHTNVLITAKSNQTIYIDAGAIVYGQIFCGMGSNFTIAGHGVLCGSIYDRYADTIVPVSITNAHDFTIRDITILDPSAWTVNLYKCKNALIDNVKIIGARSNKGELAALIRAEDAGLAAGLAISPANLEQIMVHLEREAEA